MSKEKNDIKREILKLSRNDGDYIPDYKFDELVNYIADYGRRKWTDGHDEGLRQGLR